MRFSIVGAGAVLAIMAGMPVTYAAETAAQPAVQDKMPGPERRAVEGASPARVEARIKELHDKLHITADQESKWKDVADAMRDAAKETRDKLTDRAEKVKSQSLTAVDELRAYQDLQQVQYDAMKRMVPPFEKLYDAMSAEQKKDADALFARPSMAAGGRMGPAKTSAAPKSSN